MSPQIKNPKRLLLPNQAEVILAKMFAEYTQVIIKDEFIGGSLSGSWVYRVHVLREEATPELPLVVKLASVSLIHKEWQAYQQCIRDHWLGIAEVRGTPVFLEGSELAGLCYPLMGGGVFQVMSLREYCLMARVEDITFVLKERLFKMMEERILRPARNEFDFPLQVSYERLLPVNLLVEPQPLSPAGRPALEGMDGPLPPLITPETLPPPTLRPGDCVRLAGFIVTKVDLRRQTVTLNLPPGPTPTAYSLRLRSVEGPALGENLATYRVNQVMPPLTGVVVETRQSKLFQELTQALGSTFDPARETVTLPDGSVLPNPLLAIPAILAELRNVKINCLHGDLNLENILVDPQVRDVCLIDFAEARQDHVLHDFLRLETEVITKLVPVALAEAKLPLEVIYPFYEQLHCTTFQFDPNNGAHRLFHPALEKPFAILTALRQSAQHGFYNRNDFSEYYQGLILYLLGALKFRNLDRSAKQLAFWGAATIQQLQRAPSPCSEPVVSSLSADDCSARTILDRPIVGPPILCPRQFFGRETELRRIFDFWKRRPLHHVAIIGPRRSGKTSLLFYLTKITRTMPKYLRPGQRTDWLPGAEQYRWVLVDFQDASMCYQESLLQHLLTGLGLPVPQPCDLKNFMLMMRRLQTPAIILMDEIGAGLASPELDQNFWYSLRALAGATQGKLGYVLASHKIPAQQAEELGRPSPFFNIFFTLKLGPLTEAAARELIQNLLQPGVSTEIEWILNESGRWPFLIQILCDSRLRALENGETGDEWQQDGREQLEPYRYLLETKQ